MVGFPSFLGGVGCKTFLHLMVVLFAGLSVLLGQKRVAGLDVTHSFRYRNQCVILGVALRVTT